MHRSIRALSLSLVLIIVFSATSFADMEGENGKVIPSATANIPITHEVTGEDYDGTDRFAFILTADNANNPMPEGSKDGQKTVYVTGAEKTVVDFGDITYEYPDAYYYTLTRRTENPTKGLTIDNRKFKILVAKYNDSTYQMLWQDESTGDKTDEIAFEDTFKVPPPEEPSKEPEQVEQAPETKKKPSAKSSAGNTGDYARIGLIIVVLVAAAAGLIVLALRRRRDIYEE